MFYKHSVNPRLSPLTFGHRACRNATRLKLSFNSVIINFLSSRGKRILVVNSFEDVISADETEDVETSGQYYKKNFVRDLRIFMLS